METYIDRPAPRTSGYRFIAWKSFTEEPGKIYSKWLPYICLDMPSDPEKSIQVRLTIPRDIHAELKDIARRRGITLSALILQGAVQTYLPDRM